MAITVCLMLVLGPVPTLAAPSVPEPADPMPTDAAEPVDAACLVQFDTPVDRMLAQLVKTPGAQSYAAVQEQCDSQPTAPGGGESPSGGTLTDANGNTYECTVRAGFNDACPATISVPYGPGGDTSGDYSVSPVESLHSPDGKTIFTIASETIPAADSWQVNSVVIAYDAGTGAINWTKVIPPTSGFYYSCLCRGAALSPDGSRLYLQGVMARRDGTQDGYAAALDTATGDTVWLHALAPKLPTTDVLSSASTGGIGVSGDGSRIFLETTVIYPGSPSSGLSYDASPWYLSLDAPTGDLDWATEYHPQAAPAASGAFFSFSTVALTPDGSTLLAQAATYSGDGNEGWSIVAVDTATGALDWAHEYSTPDEDGFQNPPKGITLSPDGSQVYTTYSTFHWNEARDDIEHANYTLAAFGTAAGSHEWTQEYADTNWTESSGCESVTQLAGFKNILRADQDRVYVLGNVIPNDRECGDWKAGILAVDAASGEPKWANPYSAGDGSTHSGCYFDCWQLTQPVRHTVYAVMAFYPRDAIPSASCNGRVPCLSYQVTAGFDARNGDVSKQLRWIDTFYTPLPDSFISGGTFIHAGGVSVSPSGDMLRVAIWEASRPRDWKGVAQVLFYNLKQTK